MSKEEIKHFKSLLRQGSLRHMNILLDYKFQKELLNIIKDYENLQTENRQLKKERNTMACLVNDLQETLEEIREYVENTRVDNNYMVQEKYEHILQIIDKGIQCQD
jgi:predicted nuclease with TOPRIM domain